MLQLFDLHFINPSVLVAEVSMQFIWSIWPHQFHEILSTVDDTDPVGKAAAMMAVSSDCIATTLDEIAYRFRSM